MGASMQLKDVNGPVEGRIRVLRRAKDGSTTLLLERHNIITYQAADMMARLLANDQRYRPAYIGYLYGPKAAGMVNPNTVGRDHDMALIAGDLLAVPGNMIVSPLGANPLIQVDGDPAIYDGNSITFSAISDSGSALVYPAAAGYEATAPQASDDKYYQVALLSKYFEPGSLTPVFQLFARTQLTDTTDGILVQADSELVVFWTITFN